MKYIKTYEDITAFMSAENTQTDFVLSVTPGVAYVKDSGYYYGGEPTANFVRYNPTPLTLQYNELYEFDGQQAVVPGEYKVLSLIYQYSDTPFYIRVMDGSQFLCVADNTWTRTGTGQLILTNPNGSSLQIVITPIMESTTIVRLTIIATDVQQ